ncbi:hypothetical protein CRUP_012960 [Coryphaenoides rupestris]|nr:hypothetical protein CRUP_012960 [Coryphaenoides rupestris]
MLSNVTRLRTAATHAVLRLLVTSSACLPSCLFHVGKAKKRIPFSTLTPEGLYQGTRTPLNPKHGRDSNSPEWKCREQTFMYGGAQLNVMLSRATADTQATRRLLVISATVGGTDVLLNIDRVASQLGQLGSEAHIRGLVDSGWFMESQQQLQQSCPETSVEVLIDEHGSGMKSCSKGLIRPKA